MAFGSDEEDEGGREAIIERENGEGLVNLDAVVILIAMDALSSPMMPLGPETTPLDKDEDDDDEDDERSEPVLIPPTTPPPPPLLVIPETREDI